MLKPIAGLFLAALITQGKAEAPLVEREVWSVKGKGAESLRVTIGRVETIGDARVVSVSISGIPCPPRNGCRTTWVAHAPIEQTVLAESLKNRVAVRGKLERSFERGYREWKESEGGFFSVPPDEVGRIVVDTILKNGGKLVQER